MKRRLIVAACGTILASAIMPALSSPAESDRGRAYFLQGKDAVSDAKVVLTDG